MRSVFCILLAFYLFYISNHIKIPKYTMEKAKYNAISGLIYLISFLTAIVGIIMCALGM